MSSGRRVALVAILLFSLFLVGTAHAASPHTLVVAVEHVGDGNTLMALFEEK